MDQTDSSGKTTKAARPVRFSGTRHTRPAEIHFLPDREEFFHQIINVISQPLAVLDKRFRVTFANPAFYRLVNATESKMAGRVLPYLRRSDAVARQLRAGLRGVLAGRRHIERLEFKFKEKGHWRTVLLGAQLFVHHSSPSPLLLISLDDITERHDAEEVREHLVAELGRLTHDLEDSVAERSVELQEANAKLQTLSARLLEAQEMERRHLARELHDEIGQQITCLQFLIEQQFAIAPPQLKRALKETRRATAELLRTIRRLSSELRPQLLDDFGVPAALDWHIKRFRKRTGIDVAVDRKHFRDDLLNSFLRNVLFRIVQEALTNVARHAHTNRVHVKLTTRNGICRLQVRDNGAGFDVKRALHKGSFGLNGMQERVFLAGGKVDFQSAPGKGTSVIVELPLSGPHANAFDLDYIGEPS